jgi:hypothetical protein
MRKDELAPLLGVDEDSAYLGPIEDYLLELAESLALPAVAIGICVMRIEESAPVLRAVMVRAADGEELSDDDKTLLFRGLHILGGGRDREAFQPLLRLLRLPFADLDHLLGDTATEALARIVVGVFDGDADGLFALIADRAIDEFIRDALLNAAAFLTWEGRIDRDRMRAFLQHFHDARLADDDEYCWIGWLECVALLGMRDMAPLVHAAWDSWIPRGVMAIKDFENDLAAAERAPEDPARFESANVGYIEDVVASLQGTSHFADIAEMGRAAAERAERGWSPPPLMEPVVNPMRNIGRNDPCPCGSGKKYKKCCLVV